MAELYYYYLYHLYLYHLYVYLHMYLCFMCLCMYLCVVFVFAVQCSVVEDSCRISMIMGTDGLCAVLTPRLARPLQLPQVLQPRPQPSVYIVGAVRGAPLT